MTLPFGAPIETILLVERQAALRKQVQEILERANFTVISASSAKEAVRLEGEFPGTIDLLLSDVRVGAVSGPALAARLKARRPQMHVMLMAGYPGGALLILNYGWRYMEKPAVASVLVSKIKDILRGDTGEQSADRLDSFKSSRRPLARATMRFKPAAAARLRRRA